MSIEAEAAWPAPPPFYREAPREPPAPVQGDFMMFGVQRSTEPPEPATLERQLYPLDCAAPAEELRRLNRSLLRAFVQLLDTMLAKPAEAQLRVEDVQHLFLNFLHLLNSLRPQQAKVDLGQLLQQQIEAKRRLISKLDAACSDCTQDAVLPTQEPMAVDDQGSLSCLPEPQVTEREPAADPPSTAARGKAAFASMLRALDAV